MKLLETIFRNRRKNKYKQNAYNEEAEGTRYAELDEEPVRQEFEMQKMRSWKIVDAEHDVVDLCEQMIDVSRELDDTRSEYQTVTEYLNDIQMLENMSEEEKASIVKYATHVSNLEQERAQYLQTKRRLSETQYAQMEASEAELPGAIKRLQANEVYLDTIKKDLNYLEGEKLQWSMQKTEGKEQQAAMRKISVYLFIIYATLESLFLILSYVADQDTQLPMLIGTALAALLAVLILIRYQDASKDIRQADVNRNRTVTLENHVKIKYVNIKNAVDYTCEKYHAKNAKDLTHIYELYQEEAKEREKFNRNNDDLEHYSRELLLALQAEHLYDAKVWLNRANAIIDPKEMVELKHELLLRRQKLRSRIEFNLNTLSNMRKEVLDHADELGDSAPQVQQILRKIDKISASL